MIDDTLSQIEKRIRDLDSLPKAKRDELCGLISTLKREVRSLADTEAGHAESIARFAGLSAHEAVREGGSEQLKSISLQGLAASVDGFEASHPRLVRTVNQISQSLAGLGI